MANIFLKWLNVHGSCRKVNKNIQPKHSLSILWVQIAVSYHVDRVMTSEENPSRKKKFGYSKEHMLESRQLFKNKNSLPLIVGEGDALCRHFEMDNGCHRSRFGSKRFSDGFGHSLRTGQRFHIHRVYVQNITC